MKVEQVAVAELSADPANARRHNAKNIDTIVASLRRFGQQKPIVIDASNVVRAGNGQLEAARILGWETIDVVRTSLKGSEATAYAIADNRSAELAEWDNDVLLATLEGLAMDDVEMLEVSGFDEAELNALAESLGQFDVEDIDPPALAGGDREPFQQMTFTLHDDQVAIVKRAMELAKAEGPFDGLNENGNGNAIARIAEAYCE